MSKVTKKEKIFRHIEANGNKMRRVDILKFIIEMNRPGRVYNNKYDRGIYSTAFQPGIGHFMKGGKAILRKNADGSYSVYRLVNGEWKKSAEKENNQPISIGVMFVDELLKLGAPMNSLTEFFSRMDQKPEEAAPISFMSPNKYRELHEVNLEKVEKFVENFNMYLQEGETSLNTGLDDIPFLNKPEFELARKIAWNNGWILSQREDNYQTVSYKLTAK